MTVKGQNDPSNPVKKDRLPPLSPLPAPPPGPRKTVTDKELDDALDDKSK